MFYGAFGCPVVVDTIIAESPNGCGFQSQARLRFCAAEVARPSRELTSLARRGAMMKVSQAPATGPDFTFKQQCAEEHPNERGVLDGLWGS